MIAIAKCEGLIYCSSGLHMGARCLWEIEIDGMRQASYHFVFCSFMFFHAKKVHSSFSKKFRLFISNLKWIYGRDAVSESNILNNNRFDALFRVTADFFLRDAFWISIPFRHFLLILEHKFYRWQFSVRLIWWELKWITTINCYSR